MVCRRRSSFEMSSSPLGATIANPVGDLRVRTSRRVAWPQFPASMTENTPFDAVERFINTPRSAAVTRIFQGVAAAPFQPPSTEKSGHGMNRWPRNTEEGFARHLALWGRVITPTRNQPARRLPRPRSRAARRHGRSRASATGCRRRPGFLDSGALLLPKGLNGPTGVG